MIETGLRQSWLRCEGSVADYTRLMMIAGSYSRDIDSRTEDQKDIFADCFIDTNKKVGNGPL